MSRAKGEYLLEARTRIVARPEVESVALLLRDDLARRTGPELTLGCFPESGAIELQVDPVGLVSQRT